MFEYMTAGIPIICSNFPLWQKIIEENQCGICVDPTNTIEISNTINYLFEHKEEAKEMGINGRKAVLTKYNWGIEEEKLLYLYNQLGGVNKNVL
jgi:glycosyltransferase involved in cell wall biosynthesis